MAGKKARRRPKNGLNSGLDAKGGIMAGTIKKM
jgi:hypothetical protein